MAALAVAVLLLVAGVAAWRWGGGREAASPSRLAVGGSPAQGAGTAVEQGDGGTAGHAAGGDGMAELEAGDTALPASENVSWSKRADAAQRELDAFWDGKRELFNNASPCLLQLCTDPFNYWWMAHAADSLTDGLVRTGDAAYKERLDELFDGLLDRNAGQWTNGYYDDMAWMALAWLRAYDATKAEKYRQATLALWTDIRTGWNDEQGGGIAWRKEQPDYKNTPANAPAAILAARLYERFGDPADLKWAKRIYDWETKTLVDPDTGFVWDGVNRNGDGAIDKAWQFTYNQGVYIGAGVELYRATNEAGYLAAARQTAQAAVDTLAGPDGLLPNEGDGDAALFKGILARYMGELIRADPQPQPWIRLLTANAASLWRNAAGTADGGAAGENSTGSDGVSGGARFGVSWAQAPDTVVPLSAQVSGVMLLEQMAALERDGLLRTK
jgi:predicted alpha-1,6-mannanase (GH76 family)